MTEQNRYFYTYDRATGEPFGIIDAWHRPEFNPTRIAARGGLPPRHLAALVLLAFIFAAGLYAGALLFGHHAQDTTTVVVCPGPGAAPAALLPAECGAAQQGVGR